MISRTLISNFTNVRARLAVEMARFVSSNNMGQTPSGVVPPEPRMHPGIDLQNNRRPSEPAVPPEELPPEIVRETKHPGIGAASQPQDWKIPKEDPPPDPKERYELADDIEFPNKQDNSYAGESRKKDDSSFLAGRKSGEKVAKEVEADPRYY